MSRHISCQGFTERRISFLVCPTTTALTCGRLDVQFMNVSNVNIMKKAVQLTNFDLILVYTGRILFSGKSNNQMLRCFMDLKGKFPNKVIRKGQFKELHFDSNGNFLSHEVDKITERVRFLMSLQNEITKDYLIDRKKPSL